MFGSRAAGSGPTGSRRKGGARRQAFFRLAELVRACRRRARQGARGVAMIDLSSFAKMEVMGPARWPLSSASRWPMSTAPWQRHLHPDVQRARRHRGDLTLVPAGRGAFHVVTGTAFGEHDFAWIRRHLPQDGSVHTVDVTSGYAVINLCGPKSRQVLAGAAEEDVGGSVFRHAQMKALTIGAAPVRAMRVSFTGELGYELHIPTEYAAHVYGVLRAAGEPFGIADMATARSIPCAWRRAYRLGRRRLARLHASGSGLDRLVSWKKGDFIGRAALEKMKAEGAPRKLCTFTLDARVARLWRRMHPARRQGPGRDLLGRFRPHHRQAHRLRLCAGRRGRARRLRGRGVWRADRR